MEKIGRFTILSRLGGGGFGEVWLGHDDVIDRDVAIKVFNPKDENLVAFATSSDTEGLDLLRTRFINEARILGSLDTASYVISVLDFGELPDGSPYYVMPYLPTSLGDLLGKDIFDAAAIEELPESDRPRSLPLDQALQYLRQLIMGLASAHEKGLVHRDIKPSNIMLTEDGEIRLVDFGIAKAPDSGNSTVSQLGMGSRNYMAPEQRESAKHVDASADVYAVGCVAYRMITGRLPTGRFADPNVHQPALAQSINNLLVQCIAEDRADRPADAGELLRAFEAAMQSQGEAPAESTGTWVSSSSESALKDELKPLRTEIERILTTEGVIDDQAMKRLQAMAAVADVDEESLTHLITNTEASLGSSLQAKRNFLTLLDTSGSEIDPETLKAAAAPTGWDENQIDTLISSRITRTPEKSTSNLLPAAMILLVLIGLSVGGYFGYGVWQEQQEATAAARQAETEAWQLAEQTNTSASLKTYLDQYPAGLFQTEAETALQRLELEAAAEQRRQQQQAEQAAARQKNLVSVAQEWLRKLGYELEENGELDTRTVAAINTFQENNNRTITGEVDQLLVDALKTTYQQQDASFWQSARRQNTVAAYKSYLDRFPDGQSVSEANSKIEELRNSQQRQAARTALIRETQQELIRLGYQLDAADGQLGTLTGNAIRHFQRGAGLTADGQPGQSLLAKLKQTKERQGWLAGETIQDCKFCPKLVVLPEGSFRMGSTTEEDEQPVRTVTFRDAFAIGVFEVTFREWDYCVEQGGCDHRPEAEGWGRGEYPVINISWDDATQYTQWLSTKTGFTYRLPTEAEWAYAARTDKSLAYPWGDNYEQDKANCVGCFSTYRERQTHPIGGLQPNEFGLYDILGNALEWVEDCWEPTYRGAPVDGTAVTTGNCNIRVVRGGSWRSTPDNINASNRYRNHRSSRFNTNGLRVVREL